MTMGSPSRRSVILDACVRAEFHTLILLSIYFLFAGHNQPGGGFSGGLIASCAFCLRFVAGGERELARSFSLAPPVVLGSGLLLAIGTGLAPLFLGGDFLESGYLELDVPWIGTTSASSVLVLDTGVYLVVLGVALFLLEQFGSADGTDSGGGTEPGDGTEPAPGDDARSPGHDEVTT
jgi:multisubunit Na+/H+ antiporter MnhB subunit